VRPAAGAAVEDTMKKTITIAAACTLLWSAASPAAAQNREHLQMAAELRMMQEQQQQLALALAQLADAIKAINGRIDDTNNATRKGFADQKLAIDNMANDLRAIRERADDTNVRVGTLREEIDALRGSVTALNQAPAVPVEPIDPNAPPGATPPGPAPSTAGLSPTRMYQTAFADYTAGQYPLAITGFEQFIRAFPKSDMTDDAQFYIGEAQYTQKNLAEAITAYNAVIQNYPTGDQVPNALYKRGLAQRELGQTDAARGSWELVMQKFPDSTAATLSKQGLDRLNAQRQPAR
jgi:tol-pal system protein YbgF